VKAFFADTFYWVALANPADSRYDDVAAADHLIEGSIVFTTDEVLGEFLTFFARNGWLRDRAARTVLELFNNPAVRIVAQTRASFLAGLELYRQRLDKSYSLTDCISMRPCVFMVLRRR
jgi:predicted nucleic acid-binding protein